MSQSQEGQPQEKRVNPLQKIMHRLEKASQELTPINPRQNRIEKLVSLFEIDQVKAKKILVDTQVHHVLSKHINDSHLSVEQLENYLLRRNNFINRPSYEEIKPQSQLNRLLGEEKEEYTYYSNTHVLDKNVARDQIKEHFQDVAIAYFIAQNRAEIKAKGANFDQEREARQIQSVVAFIEGRHVHLGTGEGKTSVVFPITAIVEALTSDKQAAVLATADETLLEDLKEQTEKYLKAIPDTIDFEKNKPDEKAMLTEEIRQKMIKDALLNRTNDETENELRNRIWETGLFPEKKPTILEIEKPKIIFSTERELVFSYSDNKEKFKRETPVIFMDEADIPYSRNSPYKRTEREGFFTQEEVVASTCEWLRHYIISENLNDTDFERTKESSRFEKNV